MPHPHTIKDIFLPMYIPRSFMGMKKNDQHIGITLLTINGFVVEM